MPQYNNDSSRTRIAPHVDSIVDSFVPDHIQANFPELIAFVRAYLSYLEESNLSGYYQNTLPEQRDIRQQDEQFLRRIEKEIGLFVPRDYQADPKIFYDRISDLWRSKGSQESIETFFRLFLDDPVQIRFPYEQVLIPSDGRWIIEDKIRITMISGDPFAFLGRDIVQIESFGTATVTNVERRVYSDSIIYELTLAKGTIIGEFFEKNTISPTDDLGVVGEIYRSVNNLEIVSGGSGYDLGDRITVENGEGVSFSAFVSGLDQTTAAITAIRFGDYGSGNTPDHVKESNVDDLYFLEDFLLYEYDSPNEQVGPSSVNIIVDTLNGSGAAFNIEYGPIIRTEGRYVGVKGQLSESIVLQDSFFYQKYSYEVITNFPIDVWEGPVKRTVSPAGTIAFGNIRITDTLDLDTQVDFYSNVTVPAVYDVAESQTLAESALGFIQDYTIGSDFYFLESYVGNEVFSAAVAEGTNTSTNDLSVEDI